MVTGDRADTLGNNIEIEKNGKHVVYDITYCYDEEPQ
jgi:hypothetical protein